MKTFDIVWRAMMAGCIVFCIGAFLSLWSSMPYVDGWYSGVFQSRFPEKILFKFYIFDWSSVLVAIASANIVFRGLAVERCNTNLSLLLHFFENPGKRGDAETIPLESA